MHAASFLENVHKFLKRIILFVEGTTDNVHQVRKELGRYLSA